MLKVTKFFFAPPPPPTFYLVQLVMRFLRVQCKKMFAGPCLLKPQLTQSLFTDVMQLYFEGMLFLLAVRLLLEQKLCIDIIQERCYKACFGSPVKESGAMGKGKLYLCSSFFCAKGCVYSVCTRR